MRCKSLLDGVETLSRVSQTLRGCDLTAVQGPHRREACVHRRGGDFVWTVTTHFRVNILDSFIDFIVLGASLIASVAPEAIRLYTVSISLYTTFST
jgi:hypothetical protein